MLKSPTTWLLCLLLAGVAVLAGVWLKQPRPDKTPEAVSSYRYPLSRHDIKGFTYVGHRAGEKVIEVRADRLKIEKKKFGPFRFGMLSTARLDNAVIRIFAKGIGEKERPQDALGPVFSDMRASVLPEKKISGIEMKPVFIEIHDQGKIISTLNAGAAVIRPAQKDILFTGHVAITSGFRTLKADELRFVPARGIYAVNGPYRLETKNAHTEGAGMITDFKLNPVGR